MSSGDHNLNLPDGENFAPSEENVKKMAALLGAEPFHIGAPASDRLAWDRWKDHPLGRHWTEEARKRTAAGNETVTNDLFTLSFQKDDRAIYNVCAKNLRDRLIAMTFAECTTPTGEFLSRIEEEIGAFKDLNTWVHPAHDESQANFRGETIEIDLGSGQWAMMFTDIDFLLGDRLTKETRALIRSEIDKRIFAPFRQRIESGQDIYWWVTRTHNWNTVCLNCILTCALHLKEDHAERAWYLALVDDLIQYSNQGFEESGFYTEGMNYWTYGFGNYVAISELVRSATGGRIDWLKEPLQNKMALYGVRMEMQHGVYPTFADNALKFDPVNWLTHWLNNRLDDDPERIRSTKEAMNPFDNVDNQTLTSVLLNMFHTVAGQKSYQIQYAFPCREWFDDVQFLICRPRPGAISKMAATFQGGHNGVNHNHNDLGTFTVAVGDKHLLCDPGGEIYTKRTFSLNRYQSDLLNSFGHPVPVIAGELQVPGKDEHKAGYGSHAFATVQETAFTDTRDRMVLDLTKAYRVKSLISLKRAFVFDRTGNGLVEVTDEVSFNSPQSFETALVTYAEWSLNDDGSLTIFDGDAAIKVNVSSEDGDLEFSHCILKESSTPTRLSWRLKNPVEQARVQIKVQPI